MTAPRAMPSTTVTVSAQKVDRTERSLVHSECSTSPKVAGRKAARWSGPAGGGGGAGLRGRSWRRSSGRPGRLVFHAVSDQFHERLLQRGLDGDELGQDDAVGGG